MIGSVDIRTTSTTQRRRRQAANAGGGKMYGLNVQRPFAFTRIKIRKIGSLKPFRQNSGVRFHKTLGCFSCALSICKWIECGYQPPYHGSHPCKLRWLRQTQSRIRYGKLVRDVFAHGTRGCYAVDAAPPGQKGTSDAMPTGERSKASRIPIDIVRPGG